jgi:hypothetical protein
MWRDFNARYAHTGESRKLRDQYKRKLARSLKVSQKILRKEAA